MNSYTVLACFVLSVGCALGEFVRPNGKGSRGLGILALGFAVNCAIYRHAAAAWDEWQLDVDSDTASDAGSAMVFLFLIFVPCLLAYGFYGLARNAPEATTPSSGATIDGGLEAPTAPKVARPSRGLAGCALGLGLAMVALIVVVIANMGPVGGR